MKKKWNESGKTDETVLIQSQYMGVVEGRQEGRVARPQVQHL